MTAKISTVQDCLFSNRYQSKDIFIAAKKNKKKESKQNDREIRPSQTAMFYLRFRLLYFLNFLLYSFVFSDLNLYHSSRRANKDNAIRIPIWCCTYITRVKVHMPWIGKHFSCHGKLLQRLCLGLEYTFHVMASCYIDYHSSFLLWWM